MKCMGLTCCWISVPTKRLNDRAYYNIMFIANTKSITQISILRCVKRQTKILKNGLIISIQSYDNLTTYLCPVITNNYIQFIAVVFNVIGNYQTNITLR